MFAVKHADSTICKAVLIALPVSTLPPWRTSLARVSTLSLPVYYPKAVHSTKQAPGIALQALNSHCSKGGTCLLLEGEQRDM